MTVTRKIGGMFIVLGALSVASLPAMAADAAAQTDTTAQQKMHHVKQDAQKHVDGAKEKTTEKAHDVKHWTHEKTNTGGKGGVQEKAKDKASEMKQKGADAANQQQQKAADAAHEATAE